MESGGLKIDSESSFIPKNMWSKFEHDWEGSGVREIPVDVELLCFKA